MFLEPDDLLLLSKGQTPQSDDLLQAMTLGRSTWLDYMDDRYLKNHIAQGGSKVKLLVGSPGTGKTHLLRVLLGDGEKLGYQTVYLSARQCPLNNLIGLYQEIAKQVVNEDLVRGLCYRIAKTISASTDYDGSGVFAPKIYDQYPGAALANEQIRKTAGEIIKNTDLSSSFKAFAYQVIQNRMINHSPANIEVVCRWLMGQPLDRQEREAFSLFEKLNKTNARDWLNSLIVLCKLAGRKGLIIAIDDLEVITEKSQGNRYNFTKRQVDDICELVRQLIDDTEVLSGCLFLLSGRRHIIEDHSRSFRSYDALWIRLQTGLTDYKRFNPFADLVDVDKHLDSQDKKFFSNIFAKIQNLIRDAELGEIQPPEDYRSLTSELQQMVIDAVCIQGAKR
ncbi:hypothetical protein GlitD10_2023 [Gloeomargarita lithophora Alchichica-D10]|uniref:Uncharacterized protein n=1 Tax=Gloeomargarita lithophora Alchichica-D10 TaxID=1188229 RepID=A0A1J0AEJ0_9CYAN|nr:BREX system ATP-binding domain-containing protein [Gloeomargarita lithophora]APB34349.1 hypothetical protein GlitD10_2023 [Gloeomargarita lithophora Alchichica-D10]